MPSEIELGFRDERGRTYSRDEVLKLKEEDWFSRGVARLRVPVTSTSSIAAWRSWRSFGKAGPAIN